MTISPRRAVAIAALVVGVALLTATLRRIDVDSLTQLSRLFGAGMVVAMLPGAAWHVLRTEAWRRCFPPSQRVRFATMFRVRVAAEAFSYVTIGGVTGEPLKVVLLAPQVAPAISAAATALERIAYTAVTAAIVGISAAVAARTMPLTPRWSTVYSTIAVVAGVLAVAPVALLLWRRPRDMREATAEPAPPRSRVRRFLSEFAGHFRVLARSSPRQLAIIAALEIAAFAAMTLEVYAALWLTGTPVTIPASIVIETFTRAASMASAFIPGNIGALEISNVAAASALHAAQGGVALALLRRTRGLIWCAAGFMIYPRCLRSRSRRPRRDRCDEAVDDRRDDVARTLVAIQHGDSDALVTARLGGMPVGERIARAAARAGYTRLLVWTPRDRAREWSTSVRRAGGGLEVAATGDPDCWRRHWTAIEPESPVTVVGPAIVASPQLLASARGLAPACHQSVVEVPAGAAYAGSGVFRTTVCEVTTADALAARLVHRSWNQPTGPEVANGEADLTLRVATRDDLARAERVLRASIFKPTDGRLGRFNRRLSIPVSIASIRYARLSAHAMSVIVIGLGLYAGWLFSRGSYPAGVAAALVSLAASVLDGCDGELARLQFKESPFGCWVDTLGDYVYYVAVFAGLTVGAVRQTGSQAFWWLGAALAVGVLLTFTLLILLRWQITDGRPERLRHRANAHFYGIGKRWARWIAQLSTVATRATMPYGILGFAILGFLPVVVILATIGAQVYWISLAREYRRLLGGRPFTSSPDMVRSPARSV
jgi:phosphatidylglycerophosphate synthase